eukprot:gene779-2532_t
MRPNRGEPADGAQGAQAAGTASVDGPVNSDASGDNSSDTGSAKVGASPSPAAPQPGPSSATQAVSGQPAPQEEEEEMSCRICKDDDTTEPFIRPCKCEGSMKFSPLLSIVLFVHRTCLDRWRNESLESGNRANYLRCEVCHMDFQIVAVKQPVHVVLARICAKCQSTFAPVIWFVPLVVTMVLFGNLIKATLGPLTCDIPYATWSHEFSLQHLFTGFSYYVALVCSHNLTTYCPTASGVCGAVVPVVTVVESPKARRAALLHSVCPSSATLEHYQWSYLATVVITAAIVLFAVFAGYGAKYLLYMSSDDVVWELDLSLAIGFAVLVIHVITVIIGFAMFAAAKSGLTRVLDMFQPDSTVASLPINSPAPAGPQDQ